MTNLKVEIIYIVYQCHYSLLRPQNSVHANEVHKGCVSIHIPMTYEHTCQTTFLSPGGSSISASGLT